MLNVCKTGKVGSRCWFNRLLCRTLPDRTLPDRLTLELHSVAHLGDKIFAVQWESIVNDTLDSCLETVMRFGAHGHIADFYLTADSKQLPLMINVVTADFITTFKITSKSIQLWGKGSEHRHRLYAQHERRSHINCLNMTGEELANETTALKRIYCCLTNTWQQIDRKGSEKGFQKGPVTTMKDLVNIFHHLNFTISNLKNLLNTSWLMHTGHIDGL